MDIPAAIETERLLLRRWRDADRAPFAALNADPSVMEFFVAPLTTEQSNGMVERIEAAFDRDGWGLWAVEVVDGAPFIGFVGLARPNFDAPFLPGVEVGWRLASDQWGHGYAPEAGKAALRFAWDEVGLDEVLSFTTVANAKSRRVMEKIGMHHDPTSDFLHPNVPAGHRIQPHVLYRIARPA